MSESADPRRHLLGLINGFRISQALHVAAVLGLSDHLADGPRTAAELAAVTGCHPGSLHRLLRALATAGVYEQAADGRFACTPLGAELRAGGLRDWAAFAGAPSMWQAWGALGHSVRTGGNAFASVHGEGVWDYRAGNPAEGAAFDLAMAALSRPVAEAAVEAYDFGALTTVADIGGGNGALLATLLTRHPRLRGHLLDQPHVVAAAPALLAAAGVADRCEVHAGDLFTAVPPGADAYVLKSILHDWPDQEALAIARVCRHAMRPDSVLLVLERVLTGPPHPATDLPAAFSDLNMLVGPGGQERTRDEYETLLREAGLHLTRVLPTTTEISIIEAVPAP
ncbi:methyltransferase [Virgisporangium aurantiacum]|uniref:Methyltransferase n=1 Tax=Virgisporangium aurantiacum TaxID=175570 RepID=A0A8J3ZBN8_9ACTN|nr:methyltransferase [Virgisporangium aurantiacum]GIJ61219.1 methyltransferase [Virgisporangium aurantiacum]